MLVNRDLDRLTLGDYRTGEFMNVCNSSLPVYNALKRIPSHAKGFTRKTKKMVEVSASVPTAYLRRVAELWSLAPLRYIGATTAPREKERLYDVTSLSVTGHDTVEDMKRAHFIDNDCGSVPLR